MTPPPQDKFGVIGDEAQEPAAILRLERRGWPTAAIAKVLGATAEDIAHQLVKAKAEERRKF